MTVPASFIVCEDGHEYSQRFSRLLGGTFEFVRAGDLAEALAAARSPAAGLLLDLDFRRTPAEALVDETGAVAPARPASERQRLATVQGILILRALRAAHVQLPALLFADLDDAAQVGFLESSLAPLQVVPSSAGLPHIARALAEMAAARGADPG
jgi:hypothetical protein